MEQFLFSERQSQQAVSLRQEIIIASIDPRNQSHGGL
jgi:hypothetical protein